MVQPPQSASTPVRTCVGCRQRVPVTDLVRVVAVRVEREGASGLVPDPRRRLPGRGAHLHPDATCLERAQRRQAFGRALRVVGTLDTAALRAFLSAPPAPSR